MRRRIFSVASLLSLLLCAATVVLWVRSYREGSAIKLNHKSKTPTSITRRSVTLFLAGGKVALAYSFAEEHYPVTGIWISPDSEPHDLFETSSLRADFLSKKNLHWGFGFVQEWGLQSVDTIVIIPIVMPLLFAATPLWRLWLCRRRLRVWLQNARKSNTQRGRADAPTGKTAQPRRFNRVYRLA